MLGALIKIGLAEVHQSDCEGDGEVKSDGEEEYVSDEDSCQEGVKEKLMLMKMDQ